MKKLCQQCGYYCTTDTEYRGYAIHLEYDRTTTEYIITAAWDLKTDVKEEDHIVVADLEWDLNCAIHMGDISV